MKTTLMIDLMEKLVEADFSDLFQPVSGEEVDKRVIEYIKSECTQNPDGTWDCKDNVDLANMGLKRLPLRFENVSGHFNCNNNQLTILEGSPVKVRDGFFCSGNQLRTLEGGPKQVGKHFFCRSNQLRTLEGSPNSVGGDFLCSSNQLRTLEGGPKEVGGNFWCNHNQLRTLEGIGEVKGCVHAEGNPVPEKELLATIGR